MTDVTDYLGEIKSPFKQWLFSQGSSTVLLFAILGAIMYGAFKAIPAWEAGHREQLQKAQDGYDSALEKLGQRFDRAIDRCCGDERKKSS